MFHCRNFWRIFDLILQGFSKITAENKLSKLWLALPELRQQHTHDRYMYTCWNDYRGRWILDVGAWFSVYGAVYTCVARHLCTGVCRHCHHLYTMYTYSSVGQWHFAILVSSTGSKYRHTMAQIYEPRYWNIVLFWVFFSDYSTEWNVNFFIQMDNAHCTGGRVS